jgi:PPOX class probable F420-dependent enzyme
MSAADRNTVPSTHAELLRRPLPAALTTEMPDGRLQSTVVWFSADGDDVLVNTMQEFQKARNMAARPFATLLVTEPPDARRWIEVRCRVRMTEDGARDHLDGLAEMYTGAASYFGDVVPAALARVEHPILCRLRPVTVVAGPGRVPPGSRASIEIEERRTPCERDAKLPADHADLLARPLLAACSTRVGPFAQTHPTWFERDGNDLLVHTTLERRKGRNLLVDPRATLLIIDPADAGRWIEVRGDVDLSTAGAEERLDRLTRRYTSHETYYGGVYEEAQRARETRVVARVHPRRVNVDAVH